MQAFARTAVVSVFLSMTGTAVLAFAFAIGSAQASTITNNDKRSHTLTIIGRKRISTRTIAPNGRLSDVCERGCRVRVNDDPNAEFILEGSEAVSIERGLIFFDGPKASGPVKGPR